MYRITTTKEIAGSVLDVPTVTCESKPRAIEAFESAIKDAELELNHPHIRLVGGRIELFLEECAHIIGGDTNIIEHVTVKRPVNSPKAETFRRGFE
jgi:hypothetical protein